MFLLLDTLKQPCSVEGPAFASSCPGFLIAWVADETSINSEHRCSQQVAQLPTSRVHVQLGQSMA